MTVYETPPPPYRISLEAVISAPADPTPASAGLDESTPRSSRDSPAMSEPGPAVPFRRQQERRTNSGIGYLNHPTLLALMILPFLFYSSVESPAGERRRDEERRKLMRLYWDTPRGKKTCMRYGTREYTSRLWNLDATYDWKKGCDLTLVVIHDRTIHLCRWGHVAWYDWPLVHQFQRDRVPASLGPIIRQGADNPAMPSGPVQPDEPVFPRDALRRVQACVVSRLHCGASREITSKTSTTLAQIHGLHFDGPKGVLYGMVGSWDLDDADCH